MMSYEEPHWNGLLSDLKTGNPAWALALLDSDLDDCCRLEKNPDYASSLWPERVEELRNLGHQGLRALLEEKYGLTGDEARQVIEERWRAVEKEGLGVGLSDA